MGILVAFATMVKEAKGVSGQFSLDERYGVFDDAISPKHEYLSLQDAVYYLSHPTLGPRLKARSEGSHYVFRKKVQKYFTPQPGLLDLGDDFYIGWFTIEEGGLIYRVNAIEIDGYEDMPRFDKKHREWGDAGPYFHFPKETASKWEARIKKGPLTVEEAREMSQVEYEKAHPYYARLLALPFIARQVRVRSDEDEIWDAIKDLDDGPDDKKMEYIKNHLIKLAVQDKITALAYGRAIYAVRQHMDKNGLNFHPVDDKFVVVGYLRVRDGEEEMIYGVVELPIEYRRHFPHFRGPNGERMTVEEFHGRYENIVRGNRKKAPKT